VLLIGLSSITSSVLCLYAKFCLTSNDTTHTILVPSTPYPTRGELGAYRGSLGFFSLMQPQSASQLPCRALTSAQASLEDVAAKCAGGQTPLVESTQHRVDQFEQHKRVIIALSGPSSLVKAHAQR
jgi:hypothetical protein